MARKKNKEPKYFSALVKKALEDIISDMRMNMSRHGRNASMRSFRSLTQRVEIEDGTFIGTILGTRAFKWMERGSGPIRGGDGSLGARQFRSLILNWMIDKGINPKIQKTRKRGYSSNDWAVDMRKSANAIAHSIARGGTNLRKRRGFDDIFSGSIARHQRDLSEKAIRYLQEVVVETTFDD